MLSTLPTLFVAAFLLLGAAPANPHIAASTWPIYHGNTYATASVAGGPVSDPSRFEATPNLTHRRRAPGMVSPWTVLRAPEADGRQVVMTNPLNGVAKYLIEDGRIQPVDFLRLDRRFTDIDWGILVLADGSALVTERKHNRFAVVGDSSPDPRSPLRVLRRLPIDRELHGGLTSHFTVAHDGTILAFTTLPGLIAVDPADGRVLAAHSLPSDFGMAIHNSFPVDREGRAYILSQDGMMAVDWTGEGFELAWASDYDMRGPGFEDTPEDRRPLRDALAVARGLPGTGSGTTPSLLGSQQDGIVVVVDGHWPRNRLVGFWRGPIPEGWQPLRDPANPARLLDPRVAAVLRLPHSSPRGEGHSAENSPAVHGNAIVVAQWAGFAPGPHPPRGVQRVDWNPERRRFELAWANSEVHINGVPSIGQGPGGMRVFGSGREQGRIAYSVLDLATGERLRTIDLGEGDDLLDQGNGHAIAVDGSIVYGGKRNLVRLHGNAPPSRR